MVFSLFWKCTFKTNFFQSSQGVVKIYCYYKSEFYYTNGIHVKKIFWRSLLRKKLKFSNGFFVLLQNVFLKYIFFKLVKASLKSIATTNQSSPISMGSMSKRIFDLACLAKKLDFQTVYSLFWKCTFKTNFFQSSQGVVQIYCYYKSKIPYITGIQFSKYFWPSLLRKKLDFQTVFSLFCKMYFWNIFFSS